MGFHLFVGLFLSFLGSQNFQREIRRNEGVLKVMVTFARHSLGIMKIAFGHVRQTEDYHSAFSFGNGNPCMP